MYLNKPNFGYSRHFTFYSVYQKIMLPMKNTIFILLSLLVFTSSCKKDSDTDDKTFYCKVDGNAFEAKGLLAYAVNFSTSFTIYGVQGTSVQETCHMTFPAGTGVGTYTFDDNIAGYYTDVNQVFYGTVWSDGIGTVTIEEIDAAHVKGTFEYTAYESANGVAKKEITNGKFNVNFR